MEKRGSTRPVMEFRLILSLASCLVVSCGGGNGSAEVRSNSPLTPSVNGPQASSCIGRNYYTLQPAAAFEQNSTSMLGNAYAVTNFDPTSGIPVITFGPRFYQLQPLLQVFTRYHECQHASGVLDELGANCGALINMRSLGLSRAEEDVIAQWHRQEGLIGAQYGGTGEAYWANTLLCAGNR